MAVVGLSIWAVRLRQEVKELSVAGFAGSAEAVLHLVVDPSTEFREGYLKLVDREGGEVWQSGRVRLPESGELSLLLPRSLLPDGLYFIRLYPEAGFSAPPLASERLRVETAE